MPFLPPAGYLPPDTLSGLPASTPLLLGFSGGVDSSVLLALTVRFAEEHGAPLRILHLHHGIRGEEADRDAAFAQETAERYGIPLTLVYRNVPGIAAESGESIETAARRVRYEVFRETMREHSIPLLLTAHNATDQLETVLHRMMRGSGLQGLCGIPPVRTIELDADPRHNPVGIAHNNNGPARPMRHGLLLRPLLEVPRAEIERFAAEEGIPFVTDSTNADTAYTRNRIRAEILPALRSLTPTPELSVARLTAHLREDRDCLDALAEDLRTKAESPAGLNREVLKSAPAPIVRRVLLSHWKTAIPTLDRYETVHLDALLAFLKDGRSGTRLSLPAGEAVLSADTLRISPLRSPSPAPEFDRPLTWGENRVPECGVTLRLDPPSGGSSVNTTEELCRSTQNIYNSATQIYIPFDTINRCFEDAPLTVRSRRAGDRILVRGMHRSLRTLMNAAHLSSEERSRLIVVTHGDELLWVPGLALRDGLSEAPPEHSDVRITLFPLAPS